MQEVNKDYQKNENKYKAEGRRLCDLQHDEYIGFYDTFMKKTDESNHHPHGGALQRGD